MADAVSTNVVLDDDRQYAVFLTSLSDGTGESLVAKVVKSTIGKAVGGAEPTALDIMRIQWVVTGFTSVKLFWDHGTDSVGPVLNGSGLIDFMGAGLITDKAMTSGLPDPKTADSTGNILLTSTATAGGIYNIMLWLRKRV